MSARGVDRCTNHRSQLADQLNEEGETERAVRV
jgi:hypothetical protein